MAEVKIIPLLHDNYAYLLEGSGERAIIDPTLAQPVLDLLVGKKLDYIVNTHHHWDHTDGNLEIKAATDCKIVGFEEDAHRIPGIDICLKNNQKFDICGANFTVIFSPGHTSGQIALYFAKEKWLFCGDTLFSMGCGRLFEGTAQQMFDSLQRFSTLPDDTKIYCGHEYSKANGEFALTIEPDNVDLQERIRQVGLLREKNLPTIPTNIGLEKNTNPFLRVKNVEEFAQIRRKKDTYR